MQQHLENTGGSSTGCHKAFDVAEPAKLIKQGVTQWP